MRLRDEAESLYVLVAIREGVKENFNLTVEHFRNIYHQTARVEVYEGKRVQKLK
jgi:hypothetical protein